MNPSSIAPFDADADSDLDNNEPTPPATDNDGETAPQSADPSNEQAATFTAGNVKQPCRRRFQKGDKWFCCDTCAAKSNAVLCEPCFYAGVHENHQYYAETSADFDKDGWSTGYCDCGDSEMWKTEMHCGNAHDFPVRYNVIEQAVSAPVKEPVKPSLGEKCEVERFEARYNLTGNRAMKPVTAISEAPVEKKKEEEKPVNEYAMSSRKWYNREGQVEAEEIAIASPHIKQCLRAVIKTYPSENFSGDIINLNSLRCIFHYREEIAAYRDDDELASAPAKMHINLLLDFMHRDLAGPLSFYDSAVKTSEGDPSINFSNAWMIFRPNTYVVEGDGDDARLYRLLKMYEVSESLFSSRQWVFDLSSVEHDGYSFGLRTVSKAINVFTGSNVITTLGLYPIEFNADPEGLKQRLKRRGQKFCDLTDSTHRMYSGFAYVAQAPSETDQFSEGSSIIVEGRVMVDIKQYGISLPSHRTKLTKKLSVGGKGSPLSDDYLMRCPSHVPGFSLSLKLWCDFAIEFVEPVQYDDDAFDSLQIPAGQKRIVSSLVLSHVVQRPSFSNITKAKGGGLIFALHGAPGIGKTFTAESVADHARLPLYMVSAGELGITPKTVETNLSKIIKLATVWRAVLLIDEADVFLEQRTVHDLTRNALVSLFLRMLEYYQGIMFLTTNRISTFDLAFKSRIHLALRYKPFDPPARSALWKLSVGNSEGYDAELWPESVFDELSQYDLNGRQIHNAVRTALTMARFENEVFCRKHLNDILDAYLDFDGDLNEGTNRRGVDQGILHSGAIQRDMDVQIR